MVNPTGYTALDLIGFTDKDAYSSSENYVKNDLVHYGGNIWRCLIDDTSGIAPSEGVNWTLFIGEPTNLVERIIAPVETDPATSAWAVGRQIIFNDNLYEVITAITAGDALVTYEDDPTNANIKLADPVETQLLNVKGNLSNRNLLDNAWFTVNQRGISKNESVTLTGAPLAWDRWHCTGTFTYNTDNSITSANLSIFEIIEDGISRFANKMVVVSAIIDGETVVGTPHLVISSTPASNVFTTVYNNDGVQIILVELTTGHFQVAVIFSSSHTIKAVKLEVGSISTLAMDTAPDYIEELLKCQRYFVDIGRIQVLFATSEQGTIVFSSPIRWPVYMRANPSINVYEENSYAALIQGVRSYNLTQFSSTFAFGNIDKQGCYCTRKADVSDTDMLGKQLDIVHMVASADL
ncbi:MAG: hypothetical protein IIY21_01495 [Clostridiales bacterium]|nr:hypothetical protein [Clostridiales bacterium]MBQ1573032.1 hypothetical protein [Clostridiales bacterium]